MKTIWEFVETSFANFYSDDWVERKVLSKENRAEMYEEEEEERRL